MKKCLNDSLFDSVSLEVELAIVPVSRSLSCSTAWKEDHACH